MSEDTGKCLPLQIIIKKSLHMCLIDPNFVNLTCQWLESDFKLPNSTTWNVKFATLRTRKSSHFKTGHKYVFTLLDNVQ